MKIKQLIAGVLATVMIVSSVPVAGISLTASAADEVVCSTPVLSMDTVPSFGAATSDSKISVAGADVITKASTTQTFTNAAYNVDGNNRFLIRFKMKLNTAPTSAGTTLQIFNNGSQGYAMQITSTRILAYADAGWPETNYYFSNNSQTVNDFVNSWHEITLFYTGKNLLLFVDDKAAAIETDRRHNFALNTNSTTENIVFGDSRLDANFADIVFYNADALASIETNDSSLTTENAVPDYRAITITTINEAIGDTTPTVGSDAGQYRDLGTVWTKDGETVSTFETGNYTGTVMLSAKDGFTFTGTQLPTRITMGEGAENVSAEVNDEGTTMTITLTKEVTAGTVNVNATAGTGGEVSITQNGTPVTDGTAVQGSTVVFTANPQDGYVFKEWKQGGTVVSAEKVYTVSDIASDLNLEAAFVQVTKDEAGDWVYLSDLEWISATTGWSSNPVRKDWKCEQSNIKMTLYNGQSLQTFDKGIGTHATSDIIFNVSGYKYFTSYVGIDGNRLEQHGSKVTFKVSVSSDEAYSNNMTWTEKYISPVEMHAKDCNCGIGLGERVMQYVMVDVEGANYIKLTAQQASGSGHANWADAKLYSNVSELKKGKDALYVLLKQADAKKEAAYTEATWSAFSDKLQSARSVNGNDEATAESYATAKTELETAMNELERVPLSVKYDNVTKGQNLASADDLVKINALDNVVVNIVFKYKGTLPSTGKFIPLITFNGDNNEYLTILHSRNSRNSAGNICYDTKAQGSGFNFNANNAYVNDNAWHKMTVVITKDPNGVPLLSAAMDNNMVFGNPIWSYTDAYKKYAQRLLEHNWNITGITVGAKQGNATYQHESDIVDADIDVKYVEISNGAFEITTSDTQKIQALNASIVKNALAKILDTETNENLVEKQYTEDSWNSYKTALTTATDLSNNESATDSELYNAMDALQTAKDHLVAKAEFSQASLSLKENIGVNFYLKVADEVADNATIVIEAQNKTPKSEQLSTITPEVDGSYKVTYEMNAAEMTKEINAKVVVDGTEVASIVYSVKQYADTLIAMDSTSDEAKELVKAMLNYGAYSQMEFGKDTNNLANTSLTEAERNAINNVTQEEIAAITDPTFGSIDGAVEVSAASLLLKADTMLRLFFTIGEGVNISDYTITVDGQPAELKEGGYIQIEGIVAKDLDVQHRLTVTKTADQTNTMTVEYGPLNYVKTVLTNNAYADDTNLQNVVKALYLYNKKADDYFASRGN